MKLGVIPSGNPGAGGMYQYSLTMLAQLETLAARDDGFIDPVLLSRGELSLSKSWEIHPLDPPSTQGRLLRVMKRAVPPGRIRDVVSVLRTRTVGPPDANHPLDRSQQREWLRSLGVERLLFAAPDPRSFEIGLPFVMPVHDLQHRLQPHFPEVSAGGEHQRREYLYRNAARTARGLLVDSEVGKEDLLELYRDCGLQEDRVFVLPFLHPPAREAAIAPSGAIARLPDRFMFYPAQFWPHKNHLRLVEALGALKADGIEVPLVLTGSASGRLRKKTFREVFDRARELRVEQQLHSLGYVNEGEIGYLYRRAVALVFPTFFGPTNIPIIEAWTAGCPVITSDIRGVREQVGDAGFLVSPDSVDSIANGVRAVWLNEELREQLASKGAARARSYTPEDYRARLRAALLAF